MLRYALVGTILAFFFKFGSKMFISFQVSYSKFKIFKITVNHPPEGKGARGVASVSDGCVR